jgi:FkbM family methyltransferase
MSDATWHDAPQFSQLPLPAKLWVQYCRHGPRRTSGGTLGGNMLFKFMRGYCRVASVGNDGLATVRFDPLSLTVVLDLLDKETYQHVIPFLYKGSPEIRVLRALLSEGDHVIDVGANVGSIALQFARMVGPTGSVIAIEPQPRLARAMQMSKAANGLSQMHIIEAAAAETSGTASFKLSRDSSGTASFFRHGTPLRVATITIDDMLLGHSVSAIQLIKMDIEGSELCALKGASATLRRFQPFTSFEVNPDAAASAGHSVDDLLSLLSDAGYQAFYRIDELASGRVVPVRSINDFANLLAVPAARTTELTRAIDGIHQWQQRASIR